ncbi:MAG: prepilin peptidase [Bdellovibrionales bacterium]|nr:prepilin peptidase [Bdellovibrionales bacterium]
MASSKRTCARGGPLCLSIKTDRLGDWIGIWISIVAFAAIVTDLRYRKIFNWLTLPAIVVGLALSFAATGLPGLALGFAGILLAFVAFGWMWGVKILGAGDVKLLMAFAALAGAAGFSGGRNGVSFVADLALLTLMVGGALAAATLAVKGRLGPFFRKFWRFLVTFSSRNLATEFPKADPTLQMPFGVSIAIAAVWLWYDNPLIRWGIAPWN